MKKLLFAVVACSTIIPVTYAADQGAFISLSAGQSRSQIDRDLARDRNDRAFAALVGYRWAVARTLSLGIESGYGDLGKASEYSHDEYVFTDVDGIDHLSTWRERRSYKAKAYMLGINGQWDVTDSWNVSARYGMARYRTNFVIKSVGTFDDLSDTYKTDIKDRHDGHYFGAGIGYRLTSHINLSVTVDRYKPSFRDVPGNTAAYSVNVWAARAEYRF